MTVSLVISLALTAVPVSPPQEPLEIVSSPPASNGFGFRLASLGDIDQDGWSDIVVGERSGRAWVLTGRPFQVSQEIPTSGSYLAGLAALDVDGDGIREVVVAHQTGTVNALVRVEAFDARTGALRWTYEDFNFGHEPEIRIAAIGDRTGDGIGDLVVGMPSQDPWVPAWWLSSMKLLSGANGLKIEELIEDLRGLGEGVTGVGDLDQDGFADYAVGSRTRFTGLGGGASGSGTVLAVAARTGSLGQRIRWRIDGATSTSELGEDVVSVGDRDGDGLDDVVATESVGVGSRTLRLRAMSGADGSTLGVRDFPLEAFAGESNEPELEPFHDIDHDGVREFVLVVQIANGHGGPEVRVLSGATLATLHVWSGALLAASGELGFTEAALVEDLDQDGSPELLVGRPDGALGGRVLVLATRASVGTATCATAVANSTGGIASLRLAGSLSVTEDELYLVGQSIPATAWVLPIAGTTGASVPAAGGGSGTLCVGGAVRRLGDVIARADEALAFHGRIALATWHPGLGGGPPTAAAAGETWHFQLWFRDIGPSGPTSNFSTAVEATFE